MKDSVDSPIFTGSGATVMKASGGSCFPRIRRIVSRTAEVATSASDIFDDCLLSGRRRGSVDEAESNCEEAVSSFNTDAETSTEEDAATSGTVDSLRTPSLSETGKKGVDCAREVGYGNAVDKVRWMGGRDGWERLCS